MTTRIRRDDFVRDYLRAQHVRPAVAELVACEASRAVGSQPSWHATRNGVLELHIRLFRVLVAAGYKTGSAELVGDLLRVMPRLDSAPPA